MNVRNKGKRTFQTIEGDHRSGKIKEYSEGLGQALLSRHPHELEETKDDANETSPSRVPGKAKAAVEEKIENGKRNGKPLPKSVKPAAPAPKAPAEADELDEAEGDAAE